MQVAVFVVDGVADFGFAALRETFGMANALRVELAHAPAPWDVQIVSLGESVRSSDGYVVPTTPLASMPEMPSTMIVPAVNVLGAEPLIDMVSSSANRQALDWITRVRCAGGYVAAACTGTFYLAEAGVLDGTAATTSWWLGPSFRRRYPRVDLDESRTLCRGDRVITAGASLAHVDLALSLVHSVSPALAELVVRYLAVGNRKNQADFAIPAVVAKGDSLTAAFERWARERVAEQFQISRAACELGVTERSLQRAVRAELGMTPRDFVNDIRLELAARLLRTTSLTVDAVANKVGYADANALRSLVRRRRGMSIAEFRASRFAW